MLDLADQQFSQVLANNGGLGLAKLVVNGINQGQINADNK
jgi:Rod binding domain-containing protein